MEVLVLQNYICIYMYYTLEVLWASSRIYLYYSRAPRASNRLIVFAKNASFCGHSLVRPLRPRVVKFCMQQSGACIGFFFFIPYSTPGKGHALILCNTHGSLCPRRLVRRVYSVYIPLVCTN
jgi:hypothetical protein